MAHATCQTPIPSADLCLSVAVRKCTWPLTLPRLLRQSTAERQRLRLPAGWPAIAPQNSVIGASRSNDVVRNLTIMDEA